MSVSREEYQQLVPEEMRKVYSETTIDHALNPRNVGIMTVFSGYAGITGPCGDTMQIWLKVNDGIITDAVFMTDGCGTTIAAGSMITEMAKDKPVEIAIQIGQQEVLDSLGNLPEESRHCALLAANTLKEAIRNYYEYNSAPWKRDYKGL